MSDDPLTRLMQENEWRRSELRKVSRIIETEFKDQEGVRLEQQVRNLIKKYKDLKETYEQAVGENYELAKRKKII